MNAALSFNLAPFPSAMPGWQRCLVCDQNLPTASDWDTQPADMPIQLEVCGHICHFSCLRAAFRQQIVRRPYRCFCPQCGIHAKIHHVEQAQVYQPTEIEVLYARTQYFLEVELYGHPITPVPDWLVLYPGEQR